MGDVISAAGEIMRCYEGITRGVVIGMAQCNFGGDGLQHSKCMRRKQSGSCDHRTIASSLPSSYHIHNALHDLTCTLDMCTANYHCTKS